MKKLLSIALLLSLAGSSVVNAAGKTPPVASAATQIAQAVSAVPSLEQTKKMIKPDSGSEETPEDQFYSYLIEQIMENKAVKQLFANLDTVGKSAQNFAESKEVAALDVIDENDYKKATLAVINVLRQPVATAVFDSIFNLVKSFRDARTGFLNDLETAVKNWKPKQQAVVKPAPKQALAPKKR